MIGATRIAALLVAGALVAAPARADEVALPAVVPIVAALRVEPNACFDAASLAPVLAHWLHRDVIDRRIEVAVAGQPGSPEGLALEVRRDGRGAGSRAPVPWVELRFSALVTATGALGLGGRSVDVGLLAGRADLCAAFAASILRARACAGLAAGRLQTTTTGPASSLSPSAPWAAAIGRADVRVSLRPWLGFVLGADALVPITRPRFEVVTPTGAPVVASGLPFFGGAVTLGPEVTFR